MSEIRNVTALKVLPVGTIIADDSDTCWEKLPNGRWQLEDEDFRGESSESLMEVFGPFEEVWRAADPAAEHADAARDQDKAEQQLEDQR